MNAQTLRKIGIIVYGPALWIGLLLWNLWQYPHPSIPDWVVMYTLAGLLTLVERYKIKVNEEDSLSLETVCLVGFSLVYPIYLCVWAGLMYAVVSACRYLNRRPYVQLMNASGITLYALLAHFVFIRVQSVPGGLSITDVLPLAAYCGVYFIANMTHVAGHFVMEMGTKGLKIIRNALTMQFMVVYAVNILIGVLLALVLKDAGLAGALLFTGLILMVSYFYRDYFRMASHFKELSIRDELTGLHNHRHVNSVIDKHIDSKTPFALLMIDIDHFRRYNEIWGHVQGDEALRMVARTLGQFQSPGEEIARYSGEEFAYVLPQYDLSQAQLKAEILRRSIEENAFPGADRLPGKKLTVSVGVARYPDMADNKKDLLMMVDDALYKGKFTGRNKVSLYTSVIDEMRNEMAVSKEDQEIVKTIKVFLAILNSKDRYTYAHTERDVLYAESLGKRIGLGPEALRYLRFGSFLHDIGKVEIPIEVLTKRGPLSRDEWVIMKNHVEIGERIAKPIPSLGPCLPIIRHHHERYDGTGYPDGLRGEQIPLGARILTIADSFDAMTTSRPYQRKRTMEEAFAELRSCAGKQFDPNLVEPFIEVVREIGLLAQQDEEEEMA